MRDNRKIYKDGGWLLKHHACYPIQPTGKVRRKANIHKHRIFVPELKKNFILNISTKGLKILHKKGPFKALKDAKII